MNKLFLRNQLCIPVKGYNRAIIYDILRRDYFFIPIAHYQILDTDDFINFNKITEDEERQALIDFLLEEEIIFEVSDHNQKQRFTNFNRNLEVPNQIRNVIVHANIHPLFFDCLKDQYILNLSIIANQIDQDLLDLLEKTAGLEIDSIYLYIENSDYESLEEHRKLLRNYNLLFSVNFFNSKSNAEKTQLIDNIYYNYFEEEFRTYKNRLTTDKLTVNIDHFLEAYNFHSYYFGKVYIDLEGNLKNGLNNLESFGNIRSFTRDQFLTVTSSIAFQELGLIRKEDVLVCQNCEFRFMCIDSRVPVKGTNGWYQQTECAYNPYLSKWDSEDNYLNLDLCGITVSASGCVIDEEKLSVAFNNTWSE